MTLFPCFGFAVFFYFHYALLLASLALSSFSFLSQCRHLSVSMGNAIKYIKQQITQSDPNLPENKVNPGRREKIN